MRAGGQGHVRVHSGRSSAPLRLARPRRITRRRLLRLRRSARGLRLSVPILPSGRQIELVRGSQSAVVVEVGGGLRTYDVGGRSVLDGYPAGDMVTAARGQPLVPWPNRLHGGSYTWDGYTAQVPLDEPEQGNAIHGLCRWRNWTPTDISTSAVTMRLSLYPSPPYPFALDLAIRYELTSSGLVVESAATNVGARDAPYAQGAHPYITVGGVLDDAVLTIPADTRLVTDQNQTPIGRQAVAATPYDFRSPRLIGDRAIDDTFTDLRRRPQGRAALVLTAADQSRCVEVWVEEGYPYLQVFTGDTVPEQHRRRRGLGVEPMTAPPNAFLTGEDLVRLEPQATVAHRWGISSSD